MKWCWSSTNDVTHWILKQRKWTSVLLDITAPTRNHYWQPHLLIIKWYILYIFLLNDANIQSFERLTLNVNLHSYRGQDGIKARLVLRSMLMFIKHLNTGNTLTSIHLFLNVNLGRMWNPTQLLSLNKWKWHVTCINPA